jgi:hypothetical protein
MKIDHLRQGEKLPGEGLQVPLPDPGWVWVVRDEFDVILAYMICMYGHGMVMPIRIHKLDDTPPMWVAMLFRHAIHECKDRGYEVYIVWLGDDTAEQREMREMCIRRGAKPTPMNGEVLAGWTAPFAEARCLRQ